MPVLDANALKTDLKGAAFLRGVLRPTSAAQPSGERLLEANQRAARAAKLRAWLLHGAASI
jgi:hypothetical protein